MNVYRFKQTNIYFNINGITFLKLSLLSQVGESGREYSVPSEVELMLRAGGDHSCVGQNAAVSLIEWFELKTRLIIVMEKPEEVIELREFVNMIDKPLPEELAKVRTLFQKVKP